MPDDAVLELEARRRIYARIVDQPGAYLRELQRVLDMPMGMLEYHLGRLEAAKLVSVLQGDQKRYFPERMDAGEKRYLVLLRQEACRRVVMRLLAAPGASHKELLDATGFRSSTLSYYLAKLVHGGLAVRAKDGRLNHYALVDAERAHALLVRHRSSFLDRLVDRFLDSFEGIHVPHESTDANER